MLIFPPPSCRILHAVAFTWTHFPSLPVCLFSLASGPKWLVILDLWGSVNYHTPKNSRLNNREIIRTSDDVSSSNSSCCSLGMEANHWMQRTSQLEHLPKAPATKSNHSYRAARDEVMLWKALLRQLKTWNTIQPSTAELCVFKCISLILKRWLTGALLPLIQMYEPLLHLTELTTLLC